MKIKPCTPEDWNLILTAVTDMAPAAQLRQLSGAIVACGGWVLSQGAVSEQCADIDFEFPRARCVEIYSLLVVLGIALNAEAHAQMTGLCHCTQHADAQSQSEAARVNLSLYAREGSEGFLGESQPLREAA